MRQTDKPATPAVPSASHASGTHFRLDGVANGAFRAVFESSREALLVVDSSGAIQTANPRARELLGLKAARLQMEGLEGLLSRPVAEQLKSLCYRGTSQLVPQGVDGSLANGLPIRVTLRSILPDSQQLLLCFEDPSIIQRAESKWHQADAELRSVLDSVRAGILILDPVGQVRFSNARFGELFGLDGGQLEKIGDFGAVAELVAGQFRDPEAFSARWKAFSNGDAEPSHDELEIVRPMARVIERFSRPVLDSERHPAGWIEIYSDVTERRQIQSKMLQTEKMAALGQVVSGIAHELNNPLTAIMGYAQLLLGHGLAVAQKNEARQVYQEAERARRIVKNLLYFARENKPERTVVDLNEIVERTLALRSYELKVESITVECDLDPNLPRTMADPFQLQQVVLNLVMNAEQALLEAPGQGRIRVRTRHSAREAGGRILLDVSDDGPGIPREIASRIFDPFFTTKAPGVGTGLGLSIVYGIVRQHEGEVTFQSQPGSGASFSVDLPIVPIPVSGPPSKRISRGSRPLGTRRGRILVVEDEPTVAQLIVDILQEEGHRAEAVLDSREGLALLSRRPYDLVICDLRMPRLDGQAFYRALVRARNPMRYRILFITGDTLAPNTLEFLEPNRLPYLAKPFLVDELKLAVNHRLEMNRRESNSMSQAR